VPPLPCVTNAACRGVVLRRIEPCASLVVTASAVGAGATEGGDAGTQLPRVRCLAALTAQVLRMRSQVMSSRRSSVVARSVEPASGARRAQRPQTASSGLQRTPSTRTLHAVSTNVVPVAREVATKPVAEDAALNSKIKALKARLEGATAKQQEHRATLLASGPMRRLPLCALCSRLCPCVTISECEHHAARVGRPARRRREAPEARGPRAARRPHATVDPGAGQQRDCGANLRAAKEPRHW
jgi:hypothetical protein